jgi:ribonuclease BN (tRNA processing enzyme)
MSLVIPEVSITFAGCGSFFATQDQYQSNLVIEAKYPDGTLKRLLFDCGTDAKFSIKELGLAPADFDAVYISHQHGDHSGGLEWMAFGTYFAGKPKPKLICEERLMEELWENGLKGAMTTLPGKTATLSEFFHCCAVPREGAFFWNNTYFRLHQTVHVCSGMTIKHCYGLVMQPAFCLKPQNTHFLRRNASNEDVYVLSGEISDFDKIDLQRWGRGSGIDLPYDKVRFGEGGEPKVLITGDTRFDPDMFRYAYETSGLIIHDCETAPYRSGVHPSYEDLCTIPSGQRAKMLLYHYQPTVKDAVKDGFMGFAQKGQKVRLW